MSEQPTRFSASQVSRILERAAEIDAVGDSLGLEELYSIAAEAGIDPAATGAAIVEVNADGEAVDLPVPEAASPEPHHNPAVPDKKAGAMSPWRFVTGGALGVATGLIVALTFDGIDPSTSGLISTGVAFGYLMARAVKAMKKGLQIDFQLQNYVVWFTAVLAAFVGYSDGLFPEDLFGPLFNGWTFSAIVGGLLIRFGSRSAESPKQLPEIAPASAD
ncbi:MAG: hypothetical protein OXG35_32045 [Acidobacteria bacterium]|nr:hypothetical protein [Acidobacteriota bacterium]